MALVFKLLYVIIKFCLIIFLITLIIVALGYVIRIFIEYMTNKKINGRNPRDVKRTLNKEMKKKIKKNNSINQDALKFEYNDLYVIVKDEIEKLKITNPNYVVSELYLVNMHKYYQKMHRLYTESSIVIEQLSCFYKAVVEDPIFIKVDSNSKDFDDINKKLMDNVLREVAVKECLKAAAVKDGLKPYRDKSSLLMTLIKYYNIYKDDTYMIAYFITDKIM